MVMEVIKMSKMSDLHFTHDADGALHVDIDSFSFVMCHSQLRWDFEVFLVKHIFGAWSFQVAALACDQLREDGPLKTIFRSSSFVEVRFGRS